MYILKFHYQLSVLRSHYSLKYSAFFPIPPSPTSGVGLTFNTEPTYITFCSILKYWQLHHLRLRQSEYKELFYFTANNRRYIKQLWSIRKAKNLVVARPFHFSACIIGLQVASFAQFFLFSFL